MSIRIMGATFKSNKCIRGSLGAYPLRASPEMVWPRNYVGRKCLAMPARHPDDHGSDG